MFRMSILQKDKKKLRPRTKEIIIRPPLNLFIWLIEVRCNAKKSKRNTEMKAHRPNQFYSSCNLQSANLETIRIRNASFKGNGCYVQRRNQPAVRCAHHEMFDIKRFKNPCNERKTLVLLGTFRIQPRTFGYESSLHISFDSIWVFFGQTLH